MTGEKKKEERKQLANLATWQNGANNSKPVQQFGCKRNGMKNKTKQTNKNITAEPHTGLSSKD